MKIMWTYVNYLWIFLSVILASLCTFCFFQPAWLVHPDYIHTFGIYTFCSKVVSSTEKTQRCGCYGGRYGFGNIPSNSWQAACLLYGGGCVAMCVAAVGSLGSSCRHNCNRTMVLVTRYLQTSAGMSRNFL